MEVKLLEGGRIAEKIREGVKEDIEKLKSKGIVPCLTALQVGENPGSRVYVRSQKRASEKVGINYNLHQFDESVSQKELEEFIDKLNRDKKVNGIILQMPLPSHLDTQALQWRIDPHKDAEGISPANLGLIVYGKPKLGPCTAMAVMELINSTKVDLYGKRVVMVGHSDIVGKPVSLLLLHKFATVSVCHIATGERGDLPQYVKNAEILIVAVGKANLIKGEWIKQGAIVVDVGINRIGGKIVGDVEFEVAKEKASYITPVPGGVGPVTTAILLRNTIEATKTQLK